MDTKSRSIKPALAFLAFVLGVSLLLYSVAVIPLAVSSGVTWSDLFWTDYQNTSSFRSYIGGRLYLLLHYGAAPEDFSSVPVDAEDSNLLFVVQKDGQTVFSNTSGLSPDAPLPEGYNFLLYFDGETVSIQKDGQDVDVYGDGYYRGTNQGDWYVPGYAHSTMPYEDTYADLTVCLAAAEHPVSQPLNSDLYFLVEDLTRTRIAAICLLVVPALAGLALTVLSIVWHKYKMRADRAIAWFTGRVWLEVKLLLLIPLALVCVLAADSCAELFYYQYFGWPLYCYLAAPAALWWIYLYVNDLRHNFGRLRTHSLCAACVRLLRRQELRYPVQQRMDRRAVLQFALSLPFVLIPILQIPHLYNRYFYYGLGPLVLVLFCLIGAALVAAQVWLLRRNRRATADMDALLERIQAAGEGRLDERIPLPEDSDLRAAAEQLGHIEGGLRTALAQQMKSERMKVELIANVSHDLKTPLTSIISYTELLKQEENLPEHVQDYVRILSDKSQRLQTMVRDVFEVSKAATGNLPVDVNPLDFAKLLRQTLADQNEAVEASALAVKVRLPERPVWVEADGDRLYRVFQNLIDNALKYSLDGSRVYLDLTVEEGRAKAVLRNTSRDELPQGVDLTERFVRGDESRTDGGSGLGLSIARSFTEACGGAFSIQTQADLFTAQVSFPLTEARPPQEDAP